MLTLYFILLKHIRLLKILLTLSIYIILNPMTLISWASCDDLVDENLPKTQDTVTVNKYVYYGTLISLGILSIAAIYLITSYYYPSYDYFDFFKHQTIIDNETLKTNLTTITGEHARLTIENTQFRSDNAKLTVQVANLLQENDNFRERNLHLKDVIAAHIEKQKGSIPFAEWTAAVQDWEQQKKDILKHTEQVLALVREIQSEPRVTIPDAVQ